MSATALTRGFVLVAGLAMAAGCVSGPSAAPDVRADRPSYRLGEHWARTDGVYVLARRDGTDYVFVAPNDWKFSLTENLGIARIEQGEWAHRFTPAAEPEWPLRVGAVNTGELNWHSPTIPAGSHYRYTWQVNAYETVTVPAGSFMAYRTTLSLVPAVPIGIAGWDYRVHDVHIWYAPAAKQFVKFESPTIPMLNFSVSQVGPVRDRGFRAQATGVLPFSMARAR